MGGDVVDGVGGDGGWVGEGVCVIGDWGGRGFSLVWRRIRIGFGVFDIWRGYKCSGSDV